jgi:hypothetical protein
MVSGNKINLHHTVTSLHAYLTQNSLVVWLSPPRSRVYTLVQFILIGTESITQP